jgi:hypothetical protein
MIQPARRLFGQLDTSENPGRLSRMMIRLLLGDVRKRCFVALLALTG